MICGECGKECKERGYRVHFQRAHNPNNNYKSRKGLRFRYDDGGTRRLTDISNEPPVDVMPKKHQLETAWEKFARITNQRIIDKHGTKVLY